jgi:thioredoxin-dependent peroxiredoxin
VTDPGATVHDVETRTKVGVADVAPDFTLPGTDGTSEGHREYSLREFRGRPVVLVFYPADNSPVCTVQLTRYSTDIAQLDGVGAQVLAISPQSVDVHDGFAEAQGGFKFPLLADAGKTVGETYGVLGPLGFYRRSIFVLDAAGVIRYAYRSITSLSFQPTDALVEHVRELA